MKTRAEKGKWKITLGRECTIMEIERDLKKLRRFPKTVGSVEINPQHLQEMDTAYFQLLASLRESAIKRRTPVKLTEPSEILSEFCELYGRGIDTNSSGNGSLKLNS